MKKTFLLMPIIFLCWNTYIRAQVTWEKYFYGDGNKGEYYGENLCLSSQNNNIYLIGGGGHPNDIFVVKANLQGELIWKKNIRLGPNTNCFGFTIIPTSDEGCIVSGSYKKAFLTKLSSSGEIEWTKFLTDDQFYGKISDIYKTTDNKILGCGYTEISSGYLFKTDSVGNSIWQKTISPGYNKQINKVVETNDGGYVTLSNNSTSSNSFEFTKYDTSGNQVWSKIVNGGIGTTLNFQNSMYYITGAGTDTNGKYFFIQKLDLSGNSVFLKKINRDSNDYYQGSSIVSNNRYVFTSYKETTIIGDNPHCIMRKIDEEGNLLAFKDIKNSSGGYALLLNLTTTNDNNYIFVGQSQIDSMHYDALYTMKTDSNFYFKPVSIQNKNSIVIKNYKIQCIFPNPFNPSTKISYSLKKSSSIELKLFDINGRMIEIMESGFKPAGSYEINFSAEGLSSGVYFFSLYSEGILMDTKKAVILK